MPVAAKASLSADPLLSMECKKRRSSRHNCQSSLCIALISSSTAPLLSSNCSRLCNTSRYDAAVLSLSKARHFCNDNNSSRCEGRTEEISLQIRISDCRRRQIIVSIAPSLFCVRSPRQRQVRRQSNPRTLSSWTVRQYRQKNRQCPLRTPPPYGARFPAREKSTQGPRNA